MVQVQDAVVGTGPAGPVAGTEQGCGRSEREAGPLVEWAPSVPAAGRRSERGMVSAEWAVGIIAAIGIAGVLIAVVTNGAVQDALLAFILKLINSFSGMMIGR